MRWVWRGLAVVLHVSWRGAAKLECADLGRFRLESTVLNVLARMKRADELKVRARLQSGVRSYDNLALS